jgi:hypothetical protein
VELDLHAPQAAAVHIDRHGATVAPAGALQHFAGVGAEVHRPCPSLQARVERHCSIKGDA